MSWMKTIMAHRKAKTLLLSTALVIAFLAPTYFANKATAESQLDDWDSYLDEQYAEPVDGAFTLLVSILCGDKWKEDEYRGNIRREALRGCERGVYNWLIARTQVSRRQFPDAFSSYNKAIDELSAIDENLIRATVIRERGLVLMRKEPENVDQTLEEMLDTFPEIHFREPKYKYLSVHNEVTQLYLLKVQRLAWNDDFESAAALSDHILESLEKEGVDVSLRIGIAIQLSETYKVLRMRAGLSEETKAALSDASQVYADHAVELIPRDMVSPHAAEALLRAMWAYRTHDTNKSEDYGKKAAAMFREMGYAEYAELVDRWTANEPYEFSPLKETQSDPEPNKMQDN